MNAKQFIRSIPVLIALIAAGCQKEQAPPVPTPVTALTRIEYDDNSVNATYNPDGTLAAVTNKLNNGSINLAYLFQYSNGLVSEISYGGKWKYTYTGSLVTKVETYNEAGTLKYQSVFVYTGNRITEKLESIVTATSNLPHMRTLFSYDVKGNMTKKEIFQYINQQWKKSEELQYPEYDNHINTSEHFENSPYLPIGVYSVNNPLKVIFLDDLGNTLGSTINSYTYDAAGRPLTRKSVTKFTGFPEEVENIKLSYQ